MTLQSEERASDAPGAAPPVAPLTGLTSDQAQLLLQQYGENSLHEERANPLLKFLGYFWGPIPWMFGGKLELYPC